MACTKEKELKRIGGYLRTIALILLLDGIGILTMVKHAIFY